VTGMPEPYKARGQHLLNGTNYHRRTELGENFRTTETLLWDISVVILNRDNVSNNIAYLSSLFDLCCILLYYVSFWKAGYCTSKRALLPPDPPDER